MADKRMKWPLTTIVGVGFGAFVAFAIGLVLFLSAWADYRNTFSLLNDKAILGTQALETRLKAYLRAVEGTVIGLQHSIEEGNPGLDSPDDLLAGFSMVLRTSAEVDALTLTTKDGVFTGMLKDRTGKLNPIVPEGTFPEPNFARLKTSFAGGIPLSTDFVLVDGLWNVQISIPVVHKGVIIGTLTATSSMHDFARISDSVNESDENAVFVISEKGEGILNTNGKELQLLPHFEDHPVLSAIAQAERKAEFKRAASLGVDVYSVDVSGDAYLLMKTEIAGPTGQPWIIGRYYRDHRGAAISQVVTRLSASIFAGLGALIVAVFIAYRIGRRAARPLRNLALQSRLIGNLSLNEVEALPRSRVAEFDQVALAFNAMVEGLKAMNTYVPRSLFVKLMRLGGGKAAEPRAAELTILFTDIVGFTALSEHLSAEETAGLLNEHFAILVEAVEGEGGTVDKFLGDGMLAFWGAPDVRSDHAEAAVKTARRIAASLRAANQTAEAAGRPRIRMRIGIHSGPVVVGNVGALDRWNYTVVGDTVNTAERLQSLGKDLNEDLDVTILTSANTVAGLRWERHLRPVGEYSLRGRSGMMQVYWLDPFRPDSDREETEQGLSLPKLA